MGGASSPSRPRGWREGRRNWESSSACSAKAFELDPKGPRETLKGVKEGSNAATPGCARYSLPKGPWLRGGEREDVQPILCSSIWGL